MRSTVAALAMVAAALVVGSSLVAGGAAAAPAARGLPPVGLVTDAVPLPVGAVADPVPSATELEISLTLAYPDPGGLEWYLSQVEDPSSVLYRAYLTHSEFESTFAPSSDAVGTVVRTLEGAGASGVTVAPDRLSVVARLSAAGVDSLFGVRLVYYATEDGARLYTALGRVTIPSPLDGLVAGVSGLSNSADLRLSLDLDVGALTKVVPRSAGDEFSYNNSTATQWFVGSDFTQAFHADQLFPGNGSMINPINATYPTDVAIATLLASGYNQTTGNNTPPWDPVVVRTYLNDTLLNSSSLDRWPISNLTGVPVNISGVTPPLPGSFGDVNDSSLDEFENSLDLEMAGSLAPGAPLYNFYFAGSLLTSAVSDADVASFFDQDLAAALSYNYSPAHLGVVSASFGITDLNDSTWNEELEEAAVTGVTVVAASGDQGNAPNSLTGRDNGQWLVWPASVAFNTSGVLSVGGTSFELSGTPVGWVNATSVSVGYDPSIGNLTDVSAWWNTLGGKGDYTGTEGGVSVVYPEPSWQFGSAAQPNIVNATIKQGAGALGRAGPDVAFPGNSTIAFVEADQFGNIYASLLQGTSIASPAFAGLLADVIAAANHRFGFVAPELYRIASYFAAHPGGTNPFYDVTNGSNYVFSAVPGWDATTGWGMPIGPLLYAADATPAIRNYVYTGPTPGLPTSAPPPAVPWTEIYIIFGVGAVVAIALVVIMARPQRGGGPPPPPPPYAAMPPPPPGAFPTATYNGPTFLCPYCGAIRPAEPVRCPRCGAL